MSQGFTFKHRYVPQIEQLKFSSWGDRNAPKEYWQTVDSIAHFIGAGLDGLLRFGGDRSTWSTIVVMSTKEKFGDARVECHLAHEELVITAWEHDSSFVHGSTVPNEFRVKRQLQDVKHYRETYKKAFGAWPQYYDAIRNGASYPGLLCHTKLEFEELQTSPYYSGVGLDLNTPELSLSALYEVLEF